MDKPWYRKWFGFSANEPAVGDLQARADGGDADAQFGLGLKYANIASGAQDYARAAEWYLKAAEQSHVLAQFNLGVMYARGQGVAQSDALSENWIGKAAHQGDAGAQYLLGMKHVRDSVDGLKTKSVESTIEAYKWLHLSAAQGYLGSASAGDSLAMRMSREAVTEGCQRVAGFTAHVVVPATN